MSDEHAMSLQPPSAVQHDRPNSARMYDYYLGGSANFAVDREAAEAGLRAMPHARDYARANRAFLGRAVTQLALSGLDQFLDLGSGVPTVGNVHEVAHRHNPDARVAYVDHEPVAVSHARQLIGEGGGKVTVTQADIRTPDEVLNAPGVAQLLDFTRPVALLAVAVIPFVPDQAEALNVLARYRRACPAGSALVLSHISALNATPQQVADAEEVMARTPTPVRWRGRDEIVELMAGYDLLEPGVVPVAQWRPDAAVSDEQAAGANAYGAVGMLNQ